MFELFRIHKLFFFITLLYILVGAGLIFFIPKGQIEIFINNYHTSFYDYFFQAITFLGDGIFSAIVIVILFFRKIYYGILGTVSILLSTLVSQGLKHMVFADALRPFKFFEGTTQLYYIKDFQVHSYFSFPSGHTSGAFTIFFLIALITRKSYMDVLCFVLAAFVGLSRMYLLQHFFIDTYFGALIGILFTFFTFIYFHYYTSLKNNSSINRPLFLWKS